MILLTGATGAIGTHVATALAGRGDVRALAHSDASAATLRDHFGADAVRRGTLDDPPAGLFDGVRALFLLTPGGAAQRAREIAMIDRAVAAGAERIVKVSAREVKLAPEAFGNALAVEEHLRASGVAATILRPDHFMSNLLAQAEPLAAGQVIFAAGAGATAWIDPADIAAVAVAALTAPEPIARTLTLTGPQSLTYPALAQELGAAVGREITYIDPPLEPWLQALEQAGLPADVVAIFRGMYTSVAARPHPPVTDDVAQITGRAPRSLREWARAVLAPALAAPAR